MMLPPFIIFIIVLSLLIFIHELGHFLVAKRAGIKVEEFGLGYPPRLWAKKIGETIYSINWIPFGGFVKLFGQEARDKKNFSVQEGRKAFFSKPKKVKAMVLLAGIMGNFLLGVVCFSFIYSKTGIPEKLGYIKVVDVLKASPAEEAGLRKDDQILAIDDQPVAFVGDEFVPLIEEKSGQEVKLTASRGEFIVVPRVDPPPEEGRLGIVITDVKIVFYPWWQMPFRGAWQGLKEAVLWSGMIFGGVVLTIKQLFSGVPPEVGGPVRIFELTTAAAREGILTLINFVGILSVNLAVLNLLPIPALDGGHLAFLFLGERLREEKKEKVEHLVNSIGFIILISIMILVTINDFIHIFQGSKIESFLKQIF